MENIYDRKIAVIGLGYVGLPLLMNIFRNGFQVVGFDINSKRVCDLVDGIDLTGEISKDELLSLPGNIFSSDVEHISQSDFFIVTVPTPITESNLPDLCFIKDATELVGTFLKINNIVVYESTVYPGVTEDFCIPILECRSGLKINKDFSVGYSPERINPGDKIRGIGDIIKVTSGSNNKSAKIIDKFYKQIIPAGTHLAESIKVAEAAKVLENIQRDVNIALMNEASRIFSAINVDTESVLKASRTKWNFLDFRPGLVGGHCVSVDPHYLRYLGLNKKVPVDLISTARSINESVPFFIVENVSQSLSEKLSKTSEKINILIMGVSFKENCPDLRNSKVLRIFYELRDLGYNVDCYDPVVGHGRHGDFELKRDPLKGYYDGIILAVAHDCFKKLGPTGIRSLGHGESLLFDLKSIFASNQSDFRL